MRRIVACALAVSLLIVSSGCSRKAKAPAELSGASCIPSDAAAVAVIRVQKIMGSKLLEPVFQDPAVAGQLKQSPIDLRKIEELIVAARRGATSESPSTRRFAR